MNKTKFRARFRARFRAKFRAKFNTKGLTTGDTHDPQHSAQYSIVSEYRKPKVRRRISDSKLKSLSQSSLQHWGVGVAAT